MYFMEAELEKSEWAWFGKERKGRRGGGLGFLVKKVLKPRIVRASKNCNLLWIEVATECKWFLAVVYLIPYDAEANEKTLTDLQQDTLDLASMGRVVVLGDFNSRVGALPNTLG